MKKSFWQRSKRVLSLMLALTVILTGIPTANLCLESIQADPASPASEATITSDGGTTYTVAGDMGTFTVEPDWTYDESDHEPIRYVAGDDEEYTLAAEDYNIEIKKGETVVANSAVIDAGEYQYTITLNNGKKFDDNETVKTGEVTVSKLSLDSATVDLDSAAESYTYDGSEKKPEVASVTVNEITVPKLDYEVSRQNNTNASEYCEVIVAAKADSVNFSGSTTKYFKINSKDISNNALIEFNPDTTSKWKMPEMTVKDGEKTLTKGIDYTYSVNLRDITEPVADETNLSAFGTYEVTVTFQGNYTGSKVDSFDVEKDGTINVEKVTFTNVVKGTVDQNTIYYYKSASEIGLETIEGYEFTSTQKGTIDSEKKKITFEDSDLDGANETEVVIGIMESDTENRSEITLRFVQDDQPPEFSITFDNANRLVKDDDSSSSNDELNTVPRTGYTAYYGEDIDVTITIKEDNAVQLKNEEKLTGIQDFELIITKDDEEIPLPEVTWTFDEESHLYTGNFQLTEEGKYKISAKYNDPATNPMVAEDPKETVLNGQYKSTALVIDKTAPTVTYKYLDKKTGEDATVSKTLNGVGYYNNKEGILLQVTVIDDYVRSEEVLSYLKTLDVKDVTDSNAKQYMDNYPFKLSNEEGKITFTIPYTDEAFYTLGSGSFMDLAQNECTVDAFARVCVDHTKPTNDIRVSYEIDKKEDVSVQSVLIKLFSDPIGTLKKLFAKDTIDVTLYVNDALSGVASVKYSYDNAVGETHITSEGAIDFQTIDGVTYSVLNLTLPLNNTNPKQIEDRLRILYIEDVAGNVLEPDVSVNNYVAESGDELIIDNVPPTIFVKYPSANNEDSIEKKKYKYYSRSENKCEQVTLTFTERYMEQKLDSNGKMFLPEIKVNGKEISTEETNNAPYVIWGDFDKDNHTIEANLFLPYNEGSEVEYIISASYKDGSGNPLEISEKDTFSSIDDGTYTSGTLVLDRKAPEITEFKITGEKDRAVGNVDVYHNVEDDDVSISFTIDDNNNYWDTSRLDFTVFNKSSKSSEVSYSFKGNEDKVIGGKEYRIEWTNDKNFPRKHTGTFKFDGEENPSTYYVTISYSDKAENRMTGKIGGLEVGEKYESDLFIIDHQDPKFSITYNKANRLVLDKDKSAGSDRLNGFPDTGYTAYYSKNIIVSMEINEQYALVLKDENGTLNGLEDFVLKIRKNGEELKEEDLPKVTWKAKGSNPKTYTGTFTLAEEGNYQISVSYKDLATNSMVAGSEVQGAKTTDGVSSKGYTSMDLVIDKTAPVIEVSYVDKNGEAIAPINTAKGISYYAEKASMKLIVDDKNVRYQEIKDSLAKFNSYAADGTEITESDFRKRVDNLNGKLDPHKKIGLKMPLTTQANYIIPIAFTDLAGNKVSYQTQKVTVDTSKPTDLKLSYAVDESEYYQKVVNYKTYGYVFSNHSLTITAKAKDAIGGIQRFTFIVTDENGKVTTIEKKIKTKESANASIVVPLESKNFNGSVKVIVTDEAMNTLYKTQGQIVENTNRHNKTSTAEITTFTKPSRTVNGVDFYNTDVSLNLLLKDTYSGLASFAYTAGSQLSGSYDYVEAAGTDLSVTPNKGITRSYTKDLVITAKDNNVNNVVAKASYVDNAGHVSSVKKKYNIDITVPTIEVTFDQNEPANEMYYQTDRVATIVITERNFDPNDAIITIENQEGSVPQYSEWTTTGTGDETKHTATVRFHEDGKYNLSVEFTDMAGNVATAYTSEQFVIDQTKPVYQVNYDNNSAENGRYYDAVRTATITVNEHNFSEGTIQVVVTKEGQDIGKGDLSGWSNHGDTHTATYYFKDDAEYTFTISGMDLAENKMDPYTGDHFIIDTENPTVDISGVPKANKGLVNPEISGDDTNYDRIEYTLIRSLKKDPVDSNTFTEKSIHLGDIEHTAENDDIYTLRATAYDKAGNSTSVEYSYSLNRFGSNFTFNDGTMEIMENYYLNAPQDIVIVETNADIIEKRTITLLFGSQMLTLAEGEDYEVLASEPELGWKQYTYTIFAKNFEKEGKYSIKVVSSDQAENTNDNSGTEAAKVDFMLDKTEPTVKISGLEDYSYIANERMFTIRVDDNNPVSEVVVSVDGKEMVFKGKDIENNSISFMLEGKDSEQTIVISVTDVSGNTITHEPIKVLLTTNRLLQYYANKPLFYGSIFGVIFLLAAMGWFFMIRPKRRREKVGK